jgi:hypothetical protein
MLPTRVGIPDPDLDRRDAVDQGEQTPAPAPRIVEATDLFRTQVLVAA